MSLMMDGPCVTNQSKSNHKNNSSEKMTHGNARTPDWERIDEHDRWFHMNHSNMKLDSNFTSRAERNRAYHVRHCDYSIRTNPDTDRKSVV